MATLEFWKIRFGIVAKGLSCSVQLWVVIFLVRVVEKVSITRRFLTVRRLAGRKNGVKQLVADVHRNIA